MEWFSVLGLYFARFRRDRHDLQSPPLGVLQCVLCAARTAAVYRDQGIGMIDHVPIPFHIAGSGGPFMEYHDFICLLKNAVIPLLPLIGVSACLSPERKDGDQPQFGLWQLLPKPQQYLSCL